MSGAQLPEGFDAARRRIYCLDGRCGDYDAATRKSSQHALNGYCPKLPEMLGVARRTLPGPTTPCGQVPGRLRPTTPTATIIYYGVREFGMSAMMNGLALHGGFKPYGGTFLTFSDYARNAVRMAALMRVPSIFVYTHDSIGLGEDGPTHQAVEHLASLRLMPGLDVWRPCDAVESAVAWRAAVARRSDTPHCLVFSRQGSPHQPRDRTARSRPSRAAATCPERQRGR